MSLEISQDLLQAVRSGDTEEIAKAEKAIMNKINAINNGERFETNTIPISKDIHLPKRTLEVDEITNAKLRPLKLSIFEIGIFDDDKIRATNALNHSYHSTLKFDLANPDKLHELPKLIEVIFLIHYKFEEDILSVSFKKVNLYKGKLEEPEFEPIVAELQIKIKRKIEEKLMQNGYSEDKYYFNL